MKALLVTGALLAIGFATAVSAARAPQGIPEVINQLESIAAKLDAINSRLDGQAAQITELQAATIPCTPARYREGLCGEDNLPFDLTVSLCGNLEGAASVAGKYALESKGSISGGLGWKAGLDVDIKGEGSIPLSVGVPFTPLRFIVPTEVALEAGGSAGMELSGCIDNIRIPIGKQVDHAQVLALLNQLEAGAVQIQTELLQAMANEYTTPVMASALEVGRAAASREFMGDDPMTVFTSTEHTQLMELLPVGGRLRTVMQDPQIMFPEIDPLASQLCQDYRHSPLLAARSANHCNFLDNELPSFAITSTAYGVVHQIDNLILDLPQTIEFIVREITTNIVPEPPLASTQSRFCQRFPRLCF